MLKPVPNNKTRLLFLLRFQYTKFLKFECIKKIFFLCQIIEIQNEYTTQLIINNWE